MNHLPAGTARCGRSVGRGINHDVANRLPRFRHHLENGIPFSTDRQSERSVLDIAAREFVARSRDNNRTDSKVAIRTVRIFAGFLSQFYPSSKPIWVCHFDSMKTKNAI